MYLFHKKYFFQKPAADTPRETNKEESDVPEQQRKLFIGGLNFDTTNEDFRHYFSKFGDVTGNFQHTVNVLLIQN